MPGASPNSERGACRARARLPKRSAARIFSVTLSVHGKEFLESLYGVPGESSAGLGHHRITYNIQIQLNMVLVGRKALLDMT